jgi:hypothetical protein
MTGSELTVLIAALVLGALAIGIAAGWIACRMNRPAPPPPPPPPDEDSLQARLDTAEASRAAAEAALEAARAGFRRELAQKDADLEATMDVLGHVRRQLEAEQEGRGA